MSDVEEEENSLFVSEKDIEEKRRQERERRAQEEQARREAEEAEAAAVAEQQQNESKAEEGKSKEEEGEPKHMQIDIDEDENVDPDDPVIQEFPIYFNSQIADNLHLYQYPTRSALYPFIDALETGILSSRAKLANGIVEVDVPLSRNAYYDADKAAKWQNLDTQTFGGVQKPCHEDGNLNNYMVGVFKDEELHVTPIKSIAQLRPQFKYVDRAIQSEKEIANAMNKKDDKSKEAKSVQVTAKAATDNAPRYSAAIASRKAADEEPYVEIEWYDRDCDETWSMGDKLMTKNKQKLESDTSPHDYVSELVK